MLPSRLVEGAVDDCRLRRFNPREARLEKRRIRLPPLLPLLDSETDMGSAIGGLPATMPRPIEFALVLRDRTGSGSSKFETNRSSLRPRNGSGDGWIEELVVRTAVSGDMMGEPCCEFEAMEEELTAEVGKEVTGVCELMLVYT
jgi:hypothetical protein